MKIDWEEVWRELDDWMYKDRSKTCKTCNHTERNSPEWEDQQKQIKKLVNAQLKWRAK